jgi:hypothetical protein
MKKSFDRHIRREGTDAGKGDEDRLSPRAYRAGYDEIQWPQPNQFETNGVIRRFNHTKQTYV